MLHRVERQAPPAETTERGHVQGGGDRRGRSAAANATQAGSLSDTIGSQFLVRTSIGQAGGRRW